jgi:hypothetical protein
MIDPNMSIAYPYYARKALTEHRRDVKNTVSSLDS